MNTLFTVTAIIMEGVISMAFGENLEMIRKQKKVSQTKLGKVLGLTQQMISSYEKNMSSPNIDVLIKIANYFNVSVDYLLGHTTSPSTYENAEGRLLRYFNGLSELDKEKCLTIIQTLLTVRNNEEQTTE